MLAVAQQRTLNLAKTSRMMMTSRIRNVSSSTAASSKAAVSRRFLSYRHNHNINNHTTTTKRCMSTTATPNININENGNVIGLERESMEYDVLIVGGGPAGLSSAIKLKQLCLQNDKKDLNICLIEKGSEIGSHILSGNVFDPIAMNELFPDMSSPKVDIKDDNHWTNKFHDEQGSYATPVNADEFLVLTNDEKSHQIPNMFLPSQLNNHGNYIISLSQLCRWLSTKAEEMGVEIYPGFAAADVLYNDDNDKKTGVRGIVTRDVGIGKDNTQKSTFEPGMELIAKQTIFAEGARGSCSEQLIEQFNLRSENNANEQTYGLGVKEVWEIPPENHKPGLVQHSLGWPLQTSLTSNIYGGTFLYHQEPNLVLLGLVIGLNYDNPYINPYQEFQRWKTHPVNAQQLEGGTCVSYGARVLNEGGFHSIPKLTFGGGCIIGCSAGFLNAVKIKGTHTAMKSGMLAAESIFDVLTATKEEGEGDDESSQMYIEPTSYTQKINDSWIYKELHQVRNCHEAFTKWGVLGGLIYTGFVTHISKGKEPWTLSAHDSKEEQRDTDQTKESKLFQPIAYPSPDNILTFDLLTNLQRSNTYHDDDQPSHLRIKSHLSKIPQSVSLQTYAAPETRFCPAGVYEYVDDKLVINAQNCIHCKCCSIKMPSEYINWTVPEGGGGPNYQVM